MTDHPDHVLVTTEEGRVLVSRCSCGQFSYASPFRDRERVEQWHADHVQEMTS